MHLVHNRIGQWPLGPVVVLPIKFGVDDDTLRDAGGGVLVVELEIVAGSGIMGKDRRLPLDFAGDGFCVRIDQQLRRIEAMALFRLPRTMNPIAVELAGLNPCKKAMPNESCPLAQGYGIGLVASGVEEDKINARRAFGIDCEVGSLVGTCSAKRIWPAGEKSTGHVRWMSLP